MERTEFWALISEQAQAAGFSDWELYLETGEAFEVQVRDGKAEHYENSMQRGLCFRGTYKGSMGYAYTEAMHAEAADFLVKAAKENARLLQEEEPETLFSGAKSYPKVETYAPELDTIAYEEKLLAAQRMEIGACGQPQVSGVDYCLLGTGQKEIFIQNSHGLMLSYEKNAAMAYVSVLAEEEGVVKSAAKLWIGSQWEELAPAKLGQAAAKKAVSYLGAKSVPSGTYAVVLDAQAAASFLSVFSSVFSAEMVQKGFSLLQGKQGERIAAECVSLRDDALLPWGNASAPFDSEGVPCRNKALIENGVLVGLLHNRKTAEKEGAEPMGNGFKPSYAAPVKISGTNFYFAPGSATQSELLHAMGDGLLITELSGLHAGANAISGDFSFSAEGFLIASGEVVHAVEQITVAGNFYTLLQQIAGLGEDLYFSPAGAKGSIGAPSVLVKELSIAGL